CLGRGLRWAPLWLGGGAKEWGAHFRGGPCFWQGVGSRRPPRQRCRGGGHPVRSPWGSRRTGRVVGRCSGIRTQKPLRVHPFEGCAFPCFAKHRCSPCLLVKGADCAGDGYFSAGQSVAAPRYVVMSPALTGRGVGVASGATGL